MSAFAYIAVWFIAELLMYVGKDINEGPLAVILLLGGFLGGSLVLFLIVYYLWNLGAIMGILLSFGTISAGTFIIPE